MLFILTGEIQTGKTRWLESLIDELERSGVVVEGVVAPGVWRRRSASEVAALAANTRVAEARRKLQSGEMFTQADLTPEDILANTAGVGDFEKLGIDNRLLPEGTLVHFARRRDLAQGEGTFDENSQSARARLGWEMSEDSMAQVNEHFERLEEMRDVADGRKHLLVVDEFGRLELLRGMGLTHATELVKSGSSPRFPHALIVVRTDLAPRACDLFADVWDDMCFIEPSDGARENILQLYAS